jgi:hypothetical protein
MPGYSALSSNVRSRYLNHCVLEEHKFLVLISALAHALSVWVGAHPLKPNQSRGASRSVFGLWSSWVSDSYGKELNYL